MSELPQINDGLSLETWLRTRPHEDLVVFAHRASMRVAPLWIEAKSHRWAQGKKLTATPVLRLNLASGVARKYSAPDVSATAARHASRIVMGAYEGTLDAEDVDDAIAALSSATFTVTADSAAGIAAIADRVARRNAVRGTDYGAATTAVWNAIEADVHAIHAGGNLESVKLWPDDNPLVQQWQASIPILGETPGGDFWIDWYQRALDGRPQNWPLLRDIALIPDDLWNEAGADLDAAIRAIVALRKGADQGDHVQNDLQRALREAPLPDRATVEKIKTALAENRSALPPTFDALEGLILLELERLQRLNDVTEEVRRTIRLFLTLYETLQQLRRSLPSPDAQVTTPQAERAARLVEVYRTRLSELPRTKVDQVVEGVWDIGTGMIKCSLILGSAALFTAFGLPAMAGVAAGSLVFARKEAGNIVRAAKDAIAP